MITAEELRALGLPPDRVAIFEQEWPHGAEVTVENALRALKLWRHPLWYLRMPQGAWRAYTKMMELALEACQKAKAPVYKACEKAARAAAGDAHQEAVAWRPYWKVARAAWERCDKAVEQAFVEVYLNAQKGHYTEDLETVLE